MPTVLALLALAAGQVAPAPAAPSSVTPSPSPTAPAATLSTEASDERCLATFADPAGQASGAMAAQYGTLFFYGKLVGRHPGLDLSDVLPPLIADVRVHRQEELARCTHEMAAAGRALAAQDGVARAAPAR